MPDWASKARGLLGKAVRATGNHRAARPAYVAAYELVADIGSRVLIELPHADAVYLSGSLLSPRSVAPGVSDIDLFVVARLSTLDAELEFRAALRQRLRWLNAVAPVFYNLDYCDVAEPAFLAAFGDTWAQGFSGAFRVLRGSLAPQEDFERPPEELLTERLVAAFRRWRKVGCVILDPGLEREPWVIARGAERLRALAVGEDATMDGHDPGSFREYIRRCLVETLEEMERLAGECTSRWIGSWPARAGGMTSEPSAENWEVAKTLRGDGFASVCIVPDGPAATTHRVIAVGGEGESASLVIERAERSFLRLAEARRRDAAPERPLILTRRLWNAAALLEPVPFTGAHVACGGHRVLGEPLPPPNAPPPDALTGLLRARTTGLFYRPRGRLLRVGKASAPARLAGDLRLLYALSVALDTGELDLGVEPVDLPSAESPEPLVIQALRGWISERKDALRPELARRRRH